MQIRRATVDDIDLLIRLRIDYLLEDNKVERLHDVEGVSCKLRDYFAKWIPDAGFIALIAEDDSSVQSTAFLSIVERPPRTTASSFLVGTVYNVFTYPEHRRKGIALQVMQALIKEAESLGVASVDLLATEEGKPLYDKLGFQTANYVPMRLRLLTSQ